MKTLVTDTSIHSYDALKAEGANKKLHAKIVEAMRDGAVYTRRQIAGLTGIETSSVAGRVNELIADGFIQVLGKAKCPVTGRMVETIALR